MEYNLNRKELKNKSAIEFKDGDVISINNGKYYIWIKYGNYSIPSLLTTVEPENSFMPLKLHQVPQYIKDFIDRGLDDLN
jgi:hypothetical protein